MRGLCSLGIVTFCTITTIVSCSVIQRLTDYHSQWSNPLHKTVSLMKVRRTDLITTVRVGYTLDDCETSADCLGERLCLIDGSTEVVLCRGADDCSCHPPDGHLVGCTNSEKCDSGEICATNGNRTFPRCVSSEFASDNGLIIVTSPPGNGFTLDVCSDNGDCKDRRTCQYAYDPDESCVDRDPCFCIARNTPTCCSDADCVPQEICAENTNVGDDAVPLCISPFAVEREDNWVRSNCSTNSPQPSPARSPAPAISPAPARSPAPSRAPLPSPTRPPDSRPVTPPPPTSSPTSSFETALPPPPCIAVHQLGHFPESELVFQKHPWSKVLCDAQTSCATPGHMIVFKDQPMMMSTYCKIVGCVTQVMQVNSPRYRRKQIVPSMTDGLQFTSFAARYETNLEQYVFTLAVRMGL